MEDHQDPPKRFTGTFAIGDSIKITIEYEYAKLIRHLRDRSIVRIFRSVDRRAGKISFEDERDELATKLVVSDRDLEVDDLRGQPEAVNIVWSTSGLDEAVNEIISNRVLPDEKETYPAIIAQQAAEVMEPMLRINLIGGITVLLQRSLDDAVLARLAAGPIKASVYDEGERIPRFGVPRATRQTKPPRKPRHPLTAAVYIAISETYDQIARIVGDGTGIVGLAKGIQASNTDARRHTIIRDAYGDAGVDVPNETIDWIFKTGQSRRMPTNGAIALELAAQKTISGYKPNALAIRTLRLYVAKGDKLRGIARR
jgi:hypothetical protein